MTAVDVDALDAARAALVAAMPAHQSWCHAEAHGDCCGADDCDCGVADSLAALLPVVDRIANQRAAAELRAAADYEDTNGSTMACARLHDRANTLDPSS